MHRSTNPSIAAAGHPDHVPAPLRQADLPLRSGGAARSLVADRMDITGARRSVDGAEAVLKLRAIRANGDFDAYWRFHLNRELQRVHQSRYADGDLPIAA